MYSTAHLSYLQFLCWIYFYISIFIMAVAPQGKRILYTIFFTEKTEHYMIEKKQTKIEQK
jgi:hypothetical protein